MLSAYDTKIFSVDSRKAETLADYVRRVRKDKGLSTPDVEKNSGNQITDGYVSQIENGYIKNVSPEKLRALAKGLEVLEEEIFAVARGKSIIDDPTYDEQRLLSFFRTLPSEWKDDLLAHAELASKLHGQLATTRTSATPPPRRARRKAAQAADYSPDRLKKKDNDEGKNRQAK